MNRHHLLISGTGRAGTTFLMQLFTKLGLDTGFANSRDGIHQECNAGMEWKLDDIFKGTAPYVIKTPALSEHIHEVLNIRGVVIDFIIMPIRDLFAAAESRREVSRRLKKRGSPGGLWLTKNPRKQEVVLATQFHHLVQAVVEHEVPMIWLHFPRLVKDPEYLYRKLRKAMPGTDFTAFVRAFQAVSKPELVHNFKPTSSVPKSLLQKLNAWMGHRGHRPYSAT